MSNKHSTEEHRKSAFSYWHSSSAYWKVMSSPRKARSFKAGYLDGLCAFSFLVYPYKPRSVKVPTVHDAWRDVGSFMSGAIMEFSESEEIQTQDKKFQKGRQEA